MSMNTQADSMAKQPVIYGEGTVQGDIAFEIKLTDPNYTPDDVAEKLQSGDIYFCFGDDELYDEDRENVIGIIDWGAERGDFVPFRVNVETE